MLFYIHYLYQGRVSSAPSETLLVLHTSLLRTHLALPLSVFSMKCDYFQHLYGCVRSQTVCLLPGLLFLPPTCLPALHFFLSLFTTSGQMDLNGANHIMSLC